MAGCLALTAPTISVRTQQCVHTGTTAEHKDGRETEFYVGLKYRDTFFSMHIKAANASANLQFSGAMTAWGIHRPGQVLDQVQTCHWIKRFDKKKIKANSSAPFDHIWKLHKENSFSDIYV